MLSRFVGAIDRYAPTTVVRITADCPLISPKVIDEVVNAFHASDAQYVSNTMIPTYPDGLDVEVVDASVLREVARTSTDRHEREHVTLGVYRRHETYRIENVTGVRDLSQLRWTVDTPEDFAFVEAVYEAIYPSNPSFDIEDVLELLRKRPELNRTVEDASRNAALVGLEVGAMRLG